MNIDLSKYDFFKSLESVTLSLLSQQGFSNKNYRFEYENNSYLLRKFILQDRDRTLEYKVQTLAYEEGIAAKPFVLDLANQLMISGFLPGDHKVLLSKKELISLVKVLKKVHAIEVDAKVLDLKELFNSQSTEVKEAFVAIETFSRTLSLCHNDLNPKNILFFNEKLKLIDWEFAGLNDVYFDLACVSVEFKLNKKDEVLMMESYFEKEKWHEEKLEAYKTIYIALCEQWFEDLVTPPSQTSLSS